MSRHFGWTALLCSIFTLLFTYIHIDGKEEEKKGSAVPPLQGGIIVRHQPSSDCFSRHPDANALNASASTICDGFQQHIRKLDSGFSLLMMTYKGHRDIERSLTSYSSAGILDLPSLREIVININGCTCNDTDFLEDLFARLKPSVPYRLLCCRANRRQAAAILNGLSAVQTPYVFQVEQDRPTVELPGESLQERRARIRRMWELGVATISREHTPLVFLEYLGPSRNELRRAVAAGKGASLRNPIWEQCINVANDADVCKSNSGRKVPEHLTWACTEWLAYVTGAGRSSVRLSERVQKGIRHRFTRRGLVAKRPDPKPVPACTSCSTIFHWLRAKDASKSLRNDTAWYLGGDEDTDEHIRCGPTFQYSNGPSLYRISWWKDAIAKLICDKPKMSGLILDLKKSPTHHASGVRMEMFLSRVLAGGGEYGRCLPGVGYFEHVETQHYDYDKTS